MARETRAMGAERKRIKEFVLANEGVTAYAVAVFAGKAQVTVQKHLHELSKADIAYIPNPIAKNLPGIYCAIGSRPVMPTASAKASERARVRPQKRADDFYGQRLAQAVQLGFQRDPLVAALFGSGSAA